ncbi:hypothetical protein [Amycolatopsis sp. La24]|uniref:hypothetical protein n=2 Tax=Amycolatopsis TaxID=1813 RepID=UPI0023B0EBE4|nr:hypothetical protein [Amycolatopsis sp. La24]
MVPADRFRETRYIKETPPLNQEAIMMAITTAPGVTQRMLSNGHLELTCRTSHRHIECEPVAAAMWIALKQHNGDVDRAASTLSALWHTNEDDTRYDLIALAGSLCSLGMATES